MIIGYTSGVFDMLHVGHVIFLQECKNNCDVLHVGVDSDLRVKAMKGSFRPMQPADTRVENVSKHCDYAFIKQDVSSVYINKIKPSIIFESSLKKNIKIDRESQYTCIKIPYTDFISTTKIIEENWRAYIQAEV
ncbi:TPA: adenylyltransferase/cytidyltransferase family protein [Aeromonas salmonicida subsp. pectinolytica]